MTDYVIVRNGNIRLDFRGESKTEVLFAVNAEAKSFRAIVESLKDVDSLSNGLDLGNGSKVFEVIEPEKPDTDTELYTYEEGGYRFNESSQKVKKVWKQIEKPIAEIKPILIERYYTERTAILENSSVTFVGSPFKIKELFVQGTLALHMFSTGEGEYTLRDSNGNYITLGPDDFGSEYEDKIVAFFAQTEERDSKMDALLAATTFDAVKAQWLSMRDDLVV
jgi:hypothetical protein